MAVIPTEKHLVEEITMDFVGVLPESEGFHPILVVTDWFTKVRHYCYKSLVYLYIISLVWGLSAIEDIRVDRNGMNAYSLRIKLYET